MKKIVLLFVLFHTAGQVFSQAERNLTSSEIYLAMRKLKVLGSVLYVAAHPDDENTRLIAWLSNEKLLTTGYLSVTRGEGGQNLIGEEQGVELGLIRTRELLAARKIDGGEQYFTSAYDFGYSKTPEETFSIWNKEKILGDVVWIIRKFQPDIIITRFPVTGEGGHGHHTASAILANEAYEISGDATRFAEQLKLADPWKATRVLWNTFNFGGTNTTRSDQFKIDVGGFNSLLGKSYGEIAAESRSQHKSQGFGVPSSRGEIFEYFVCTKGKPPVQDLMDDIDISWRRIPGGERIEQMIDTMLASYDFLRPQKAVVHLIKLYESVLKLPDGIWKTRKLSEIKSLIRHCGGIYLEASAASPYAVQKDSVKIQFTVNNRNGIPSQWLRLSVDSYDSVMSALLPTNKNVSFTKTFYVSMQKPVSQPYWLEEKMEEGHFTISRLDLAGSPESPPAFEATFTLKILDQVLEFTVPVKYKFTDPVKGELYQPLVVIPPVMLHTPQPVKVSRNTKRFTGSVEVQFYKNPLEVSPVMAESRFNQPFSFRLHQNRVTTEKTSNRIRVPFMIESTDDDEYMFFVKEKNNFQTIYNLSLREIKYDHIPYISYFTRATVIHRMADLKTAGKKIGYITGAGDKVPDALEQMGFEVDLLGEKELERANLSAYDAIITGVRAYNTHEWLNKYYEKLMNYVKQGGNLIVQYNTSTSIGPLRAKIGPYPFNITRNRVTDEQAGVTLLKPEHPVFHFPNKITSADFKGWVQERSIYHASDSAGKYEKLLRMADAGETSDDGSLLITRYGKGWFTYTGLVFFRQLPAGVTGAYRLLANLIALNQHKKQ
ncbi:MAG: PIG-L family deacetylase [Chitinophagaceae bacterium]|nr:PIG-L family deacetylase [Chitinophagaceae bacterium]